MAAPVYTVEVGWEKPVAGRFRLGHSLLDGTDTLTSTFDEFFGATFDDVSEDVERFRIRRGRPDVGGGMRAGELELVLADLAGTYNPLSEDSPIAALDPGFQPMRPIRVTSVFDGPAAAGLTLSGNEITDALRTIAAQGDGRATPDSSHGVWEATTNLIPNGGAETNANGASAIGATTVSRSPEQAKFGGFGFKVVTTGAGAAEGVVFASNTGLAAAAGTVSIGSCWVYSAAGGELVNVWSRWVHTDASTVDSTVTAVVLAPGWNRLLPASVAVTAAKVGDQVRVIIRNQGTSAYTYWVDGVQDELQPIATPYVHTDGATATRAAAREQAPASLIDETQGWIAMRVRTGWASTISGLHGGGTTRFFEWGDDASNRIIVYYDESNDKLNLQRRLTAGSQSTSSAALVFAAGEVKTIIAAWDAATVKLSVDGGAFVSVGGTPRIPTLAATTFDIGRGPSNEWSDSDYLCFACGTGTLTDVDAKTIVALLARDASPSHYPTAASCTAVMPFDTGEYLIPGETYEHFFGWIRRADFDPDTLSCTIHAQDLFLWLERSRPVISAGATTVGEAIGLILDAIEWTEPDLRDLATGDTLGAAFTADGSKTALQLIDELLAADRGVFFIRGDGTAVYEDRHAIAQRDTSVASLTDVLVTSGSAIDLDGIINRITVTKTGGVEQSVEDLPSIAAYGPNEGQRIDSPYLGSDALAASLARYLIVQAAQPRPPVRFEIDDPAELVHLLGLELQDRVTLETGELGADGDFHVEQLEHEVTGPGFDHLVRVVASKRPPEVVRLGISTLGSTDSLTH